MSDSTLVLHVGAPKCGSSSLQTALSKRPTFYSRSNRRFVYNAIQGRSWLNPAKIRLGAKIGFSGYVASHGLHKYGDSEAGARILRHHAPRLSKMLKQGVTPILSCEGWLPQAPTFAASGVLADLPAPTHVVMFVRSPLDWLNSAWWQWGIWTEPDIETFLAKHMHRAAWVNYVKSWKAVPGVERVSVRPINRSVVGSFYELLDCAPPSEVRSNAAVPQPFLQLMVRNRHLRPDAESPEAEFIVGTRIGKRGDPSAWALPSELHTEILSELEADTQALLEHLDPADRDIVRNDPAWWDAAHFSGRKQISLEELNTPEVLTDLYQRLCRLARQNPDQRTIASISEAAVVGDLAAADAPLLQMVDVIYSQSFRWKATRVRRRLRAMLGRAPLR